MGCLEIRSCNECLARLAALEGVSLQRRHRFALILPGRALCPPVVESLILLVTDNDTKKNLQNGVSHGYLLPWKRKEPITFIPRLKQMQRILPIITWRIQVCPLTKPQEYSFPHSKSTERGKPYLLGVRSGML